MKKSTRILRTVLLGIISVLFLMAGIAKLAGNANEVAMFAAVHLLGVMIAIGIIEVAIAVMVWWSKTRDLALLLGTAVMGAAIAEVISMGTNSAAIAPGIIILMMWIVFDINRYGKIVL